MAKEHSEKFEEITFKYMKELYAVALRLIKNSDEAEDLVQDTYLKAYRFFYRFKKGTNCKAWLFKIMVRLFYTRYHKRKIEVLRSARIEEENIINLQADPENAYINKMKNEEILQAINNLPELHRIILILADVEEMSYNEISEILKIPMGTVMSRLHRARKRLANELRYYAQKEGLLSMR